MGERGQLFLFKFQSVPAYADPVPAPLRDHPGGNIFEALERINKVGSGIADVLSRYSITSRCFQTRYCKSNHECAEHAENRPGKREPVTSGRARKNSATDAKCRHHSESGHAARGRLFQALL